MMSHAPAFGHSPGFAHSPAVGFGSNSFRRPFFPAGNGFYRRVPRFGFGGYPWSYGGYPGLYYGYPFDYEDWQGPSYYTQPTYDAGTGSYDQSSQIQQDEIDRLENQVERLRNERARGAEPQKSESSEPTTIVFRDEHSEQVQNYAIVGQTLWIFDEQHARKVPLADLDVPATTKANEDRGVDFRLPE